MIGDKRSPAREATHATVRSEVTDRGGIGYSTGVSAAEQPGASAATSRGPGLRFGSAPRGAVVVGAHVNALGIVRSLAPLGIPVAVVSTRPFDIAQRSRDVVASVSLPSFHDDPESLLDVLDAHAREWHGWALFPTNDDAVVVLAQHHERLSKQFRSTVPPWEVMGPLVDKDRMHELATNVGLDVPRCHGEARPDLDPRSVTFPAIVKPIRHDRLIGAAGVKLFLARDPPELAAACARLASVGLRGLVYEMVPGPDSEIYVYAVYVGANGEPSVGATVRKLRQNPPGIGGARVAEIATEDPALREASVELLRRAGFRGIAFVEFKRDRSSGRFRFIEVNGRPVLFNRLPARAGIDLVRMAWSELCGERPSARPSGWRGAWIDFQADLFCALFLRRVETLRFADYVAPYRGRKIFAVWSARDPGPFVAQVERAAHDLTRSLVDRESRRAWFRRLRPGDPGDGPERSSPPSLPFRK
jgi:D-aspartate ligase